MWAARAALDWVWMICCAERVAVMASSRSRRLVRAEAWFWPWMRARTLSRPEAVESAGAFVLSVSSAGAGAAGCAPRAARAWPESFAVAAKAAVEDAGVAGSGEGMVLMSGKKEEEERRSLAAFVGPQGERKFMDGSFH